MRGPFVLVGHELGDLGLGFAGADLGGDLVAEGFDGVAVGEEAHFVGDFAVAGDDAVDVELQGFVESFGPFDDAAAAVVVDEGAGGGHEVAGVEGFEAGEVDESVAVGVAAAEVEGANFLAAEEDAHLLIKNEAGGGHAGLFVGLFVAEDAVAGVDSGDHVGGGEVFGVATGMVGVVVGGEDVFDGEGGDGADFGGDLVMVALVFVIDEDDAFGGDEDGYVATVALNFIEIFGDFRDGEFGGGGGLGEGGGLEGKPAKAEEEGGGSGSGQEFGCEHIVVSGW